MVHPINVIITTALAIVAFVQTPVWKPYTLGDGFTVSLPAKPTMEKDEEDPTFVTWTSIHPQGHAIQVSFIPEDDPQPADMTMGDFLAGMVQGGATPIRIKDLMLHGWPAAEYALKVDGSILAGRIFATEKALYTISVISDTEKTAAPLAQKLYASFKLSPKVERGPMAKAGPTLTPFTITPELKVSVPREPVKEKVPLPNNTHGLVSERYVSRFGNRVFLVVTIDFPDEIMEEIETASAAALAGQFNDEFIRSLQAKALKLGTYKLGEIEVISQTLSLQKDIGWGRIDSFRKDKRFYCVVQLAMKAARVDKETEEYFKSITLGSSE